MCNPEPRFYPSYCPRIDDYDAWRAMDTPLRDRGAERPTKRDRRDLEREGFRRDASGDYGDED